MFSKDLYSKLKTGFAQLFNNVPLVIGIMTNSLARLNTLLITLFLIMWIKQHDLSDAESINLGHMISGIGNSVGLVSAGLFGFLFEKKNVSNFLLLTNFLVIIGYIGFYLAPGPHHWLVTVSISVASFGFYGLMTIGYVMVNEYCGKSCRGSVMGINCLFGAIAILILAQGGGYAFDKIDKSAPFLAASFFSIILFIIVLFTRSALSDVKPSCPVEHKKVTCGDVNEENEEEEEKTNAIADIEKKEDI